MTNNIKKISRFGLGSSAIAVSMVLAAPAFAQSAASTPADAPADDSVIVVTGSLIKNPNLQQATPVNVTTADQIALKQNNTAEEILREIPGIVPNIGSAVNNGNGGASFVDLRGLGPRRTVVLLDGNRLVPADLTGQFDLNNIPVALINRVDVLTGGSSTTYGADAIAGVVNFVTKQDFTGVEINAGDQITERGDGNVVKADVTIGGNFDEGKGNAVFSVGYQQSDPVYQGARSFSAVQLSSFTGGISGSGTSVPSRFSNVNPNGTDFIATGCGGTTGIACVTTAAQGTRQVNGAGTAFNSGSAFTPYNFNPFNIFQTPFKRYNMYGAAHYDISDAVTAYTRGIFSKNSVDTIIAPSGAFGIPVTVNLNNPYLTTALRNGFCQLDTNTGPGYTPLYSPAVCAAAATATGPGDPNYRTVTTTVSRRAVELGPRTSDFTTTFFDYKAGLKGKLTNSIDWDVYGSYGESENVQTQSGYTLNSKITQAALANNTTTCITNTGGCVPINLFGPAGSISPTMLSFIQGTSQISIKTSLAQIHGLVSGDVGVASPWGTDAINFAIGAEYRNYHASQFSDALSKSGDLGGSGGAAPAINGGYKVYEAYGELVVPVVQDKPFFQDLTATGGVRYSHYEVQAPTTPSYDSTTYKGELSWTPVKGIKLRGNYSHSVRAPNIGELFAPQNTGLTTLAVDPCAGSAPLNNANLKAICTAQGAPTATLGIIANPSSAQANATSGGNLNLKPEKSDSYSFGAVLQPSDYVRNLSLSVDYYHIKVDQAVSTPTPQDAINSCFGAPVNGVYSPSASAASSAACTQIRRNPGTGGLDGPANTTPGLLLASSNLGRLATAGIDVTLNYSYAFSWAKLSIAANGNWTQYAKFQAVAGGTGIYRDCVGYYSSSCASLQPKWQTSLRTTLSFEPGLDVSLLWRHIDKMKQEPDDILNGNGPAFQGVSGFGNTVDFQTIKAYDIFDLSTRVNIMENVTLTFTVQNLFDKTPPVVGTNVGAVAFNSGNVYPSTYDALGRRYAAAVKFKF